MKLIILRHGETVANTQHILQGRYDTDLTNKGEKQAKNTANILKKEKIDIIYSSPLKRAKETAEIINKTIDAPVLIEQDLIEISYGDWDGKSKFEIRKKFPELWKDKESDKYNFVHPGSFGEIPGQSYKKQYRQIERLIEKLKKTDYQSVVLVSHLGNIRNFKKYFEDLSDEQVSNYIPSNDVILRYEI